MSDLAEIASQLHAFLAKQRWYGEKASAIESATIADSGTSGEIRHLIVDVQPAGAPAARYYVPVVSDQDGEIADATATPEYHRFLAEMHRDGGTLPMAAGTLVWRRTKAGETTGLTGGARTLSVEQSNSSVRFDDAALVKIFRRLQPGVNPEIELTQFLTERTDFRNAPALLGWLDYQPNDGEVTAIAVAQSFVSAIGDGWSTTLDELRALNAAEQHERPAIENQSLGLIRQLGRRTAQMHLALGSDPWTPDLAPERITVADVDAWRESFVALLRRVSAALDRFEPSDERAADLKRAFDEARPRIEQQTAGFERLIGSSKMRVHGDYHLGQTLQTKDGDWFVLDFEGEPRRPLAERRTKTSPLKDVAGMLRSFSYARGTVEREAEADAAELVTWERGARTAFLAGYLDEARAHHASFVPIADEEFRFALNAWELDKAIYEIDYELNNRPDWLWLPLSAAVKFA
jgi:maltose alpha-D-glucosyltransferase/alpha-amylase